jgi:hypothetical protein
MADGKLMLETVPAGGSVTGHLPAKGMAKIATRPVNFSRSGPYFAALFVLALIAYWNSYLSQILSASNYTHFHASLAALWILMLVAQPMLIRAKRLTWHRVLGDSPTCWRRSSSSA